MKTITNAIFLLAITCSCLTYGQSGCGSTVSVTSRDSKTTYLETVYNAEGNVESTNGAIPWDTPVRFTISTPCTATSYFLSPELQGGYDSYESGSSIFNSDNRLVEFMTSLTNAKSDDDPQITLQISLNGVLKTVVLPATPPPPPPATCFTYEITRCGEMNCVTFQRIDTLCHLCYKIFVKYTDGSTGTFPISFSTGETVMICSEKEVSSVNGSIAIDCKEGSFERPAPAADLTKRISLYPNPAQSEIYFEGESPEGYKFSMFDANGRKIISDVTPDHPISISQYARGMYFYILSDEKGYSQSGKVIKQ